MKYIGIDYGDARTGLAISDLSGTLAGELTLLRGGGLEGVARQVAAACEQNGVKTVVLGYPKNMNGTIGERGKKSEELAELLKESYHLDVVLWDERRTTVSAEMILNEAGRRGKKKREKLDIVAAVLILQGYLDSLRR